MLSSSWTSGPAPAAEGHVVWVLRTQRTRSPDWLHLLWTVQKPRFLLPLLRQGHQGPISDVVLGFRLSNRGIFLLKACFQSGVSHSPTLDPKLVAQVHPFWLFFCLVPSVRLLCFLISSWAPSPPGWDEWVSASSSAVRRCTMTPDCPGCVWVTWRRWAAGTPLARTVLRGWRWLWGLPWPPWSGWVSGWRRGDGRRSTAD